MLLCQVFDIPAESCLLTSAKTGAVLPLPLLSACSHLAATSSLSMQMIQHLSTSTLTFYEYEYTNFLVG